MILKKLRLPLVIFLFIMVASTKAVEIGIPFTVGDAFSLGARIHITDSYAVEPLVGFQFQDNNNALSLDIRNLFYIREQNDLEHYVGGNIYVTFQENIDTQFGLGGFYGLQYPITDAVEIFGELGAIFNIEPTSIFSTLRSGVGIIFYIR
ncbi:hypothetical protein QA601_11440 [Chitinispirillales bacterium ANBcel5]|uniref:hypothetical protein n=1 Tax=Cellulosispirillum alkaliphilum TaxID=3039283 RepID=UPI002A4E7ED2|nr:hypothetical protein [Chitinispirillales bacterium ANBcel5]